MKLPIGTPIINLDSPNAKAELLDALGVKEGDKIELITPQFNRVDDFLIAVPDKHEKFFMALLTFSDAQLSEIGLQKWDETEEGTSWLFPHQWYSGIPEGFEVTDINGKKELFKNGITDDDMRFGALAYGIFKENQQ